MNKQTNLQKKFASAADSQINKAERLSADKKTYADPEEKLKQGQAKASLGEELDRQTIEDRKSNRELREKYAEKMFHYMYIWSFFIILAVIFSGLDFCGLWKVSFQLDKWILIALIGSATVSIFAIIRAVIKGIFKE